MAEMDPHREQDVYHAHYHFWNWLPYATGESEAKGSFAAACIYPEGSRLVIAGVCSRDFLKHPGHPDFLRTRRRRLISGAKCYKSTTLRHHGGYFSRSHSSR